MLRCPCSILYVFLFLLFKLGPLLTIQLKIATHSVLFKGNKPCVSHRNQFEAFNFSQEKSSDTGIKFVSMIADLFLQYIYPLEQAWLCVQLVRLKNEMKCCLFNDPLDNFGHMRSVIGADDVKSPGCF